MPRPGPGCRRKPAPSLCSTSSTPPGVRGTIRRINRSGDRGDPAQGVATVWHMTQPALARAEALDAADPLAAYRDRFVIADPETVYLDGNSLGRLPVATRERLRVAIEREWGTDLIRGWTDWIGLAR